MGAARGLPRGPTCHNLGASQAGRAALPSLWVFPGSQAHPDPGSVPRDLHPLLSLLHPLPQGSLAVLSSWECVQLPQEGVALLPPRPPDHPTGCRVWGKTTEEKTPAVKDPRDHGWPPGCWESGCLWGQQPWLSERTRGRHSPGVMLGLWGAVGSVSSFHTHSALPTRGGAVTSPPSSNP